MSTLTTGADLGRAVRRLRKAHGLKIETLAFAAEMHPTYLSGIERGRRNPTWRKLCGLADALDVSVAALASQAEEEAAVARIAQAARTRLRTQFSAFGTSQTRQQNQSHHGPALERAGPISLATLAGRMFGEICLPVSGVRGL